MLSIVQTHGIRLYKVILVILQMVTAVFIYRVRKLRIDVEFMIRKKLCWCTKFSWVFVVVPVMGLVLIELLITVDLFAYKNRPLPSWAIGKYERIEDSLKYFVKSNIYDINHLISIVIFNACNIILAWGFTLMALVLLFILIPGIYELVHISWKPGGGLSCSEVHILYAA